MARSLKNKVNVEPPDGDFPYGRIKDNTGIGDGTPVDENTYGDHHQFFARLMEYVMEYAKDGFEWNEEPDSAYVGFQLFEALQRFKPYKYYVAIMNQTGTSAPVPTILENNIGTISWAHSGVGEYQGTLSGAFTALKTWTMAVCGPGGTGGPEVVNLLRVDANTVVLRCYDNAGAPSDDILIDTAIEIRVYP